MKVYLLFVHYDGSNTRCLYGIYTDKQTALKAAESQYYNNPDIEEWDVEEMEND